ncbi:hypothetical protein ACFQ8S_30485 [Streptomyces virginiae]|uniref:hypothetical protein n=1 Tax=Streptomyces virginiae TaxID=1961 RepID=UPI0036AFD7E2
MFDTVSSPSAEVDTSVRPRHGCDALRQRREGPYDRQVLLRTGRRLGGREGRQVHRPGRLQPLLGHREEQQPLDEVLGRRGPQLVRRVRREPPPRGDQLLHPPQHRVEGVGVPSP